MNILDYFLAVNQNETLKFSDVELNSPTVTAATTGETMTDSVTPPAITRFLLCFEISFPS